MGRMKDLLLDYIYNLSDETGYDIEFLLERYKELGNLEQVAAAAKRHVLK